MAELKLLPDVSAYNVQDGMSVVQTQLDGGASRFRQDKIGAASLVDVQWTLDRSEYRYFTAFYNTVISFGALPFTIPLILDHPDAKLYSAYFIPETKELVGQSGLSYTVKAQLEVMPEKPNAALDVLIVSSFAADPNYDVTLIQGDNTSEPPVPDGTIPNQTTDNGVTISNLLTKPFFDDPDDVGLTFEAANLPGGLQINPANGIIFGTVNEVPTVFLVTVVATNNGGSANQQFSWTILDPA